MASTAREALAHHPMEAVRSLTPMEWACCIVRSRGSHSKPWSSSSLWWSTRFAPGFLLPCHVFACRWWPASSRWRRRPCRSHGSRKPMQWTRRRKLLRCNRRMAGATFWRNWRRSLRKPPQWTGGKKRRTRRSSQRHMAPTSSPSLATSILSFSGALWWARGGRLPAPSRQPGRGQEGIHPLCGVGRARWSWGTHQHGAGRMLEPHSGLLHQHGREQRQGGPVDLAATFCLSRRVSKWHGNRGMPAAPANYSWAIVGEHLLGASWGPKSEAVRTEISWQIFKLCWREIWLHIKYTRTFWFLKQTGTC